MDLNRQFTNAVGLPGPLTRRTVQRVVKARSAHAWNVAQLSDWERAFVLVDPSNFTETLCEVRRHLFPGGPLLLGSPELFLDANRLLEVFVRQCRVDDFVAILFQEGRLLAAFDREPA
jgi:hypothetical protein